MRKASLFSQHASVEVVSAEYTDGFDDLKRINNVRLISRDLSLLTDDELNELVRDAFIVVPATSNMYLNDRICQLCHDRGILVNEVNNAGDVIIPSVVCRGDLNIGICTLGSSPAMSKFIRQKLDDVFTEEYGSMIRLQAQMRDILKENVPDQKDRKRVLWEILESDEVWEGLKNSYDKGYEIAYDIFQKHIDREG